AAEAARAGQDLRAWSAAALDRHPVLALPTLTGSPPLLGERGMSLTVLTMPANLAGLPALSLPFPGGPAGPAALAAPPGPGRAGGPARLAPAHRAARRRGAADSPRPRDRGRPGPVTPARR